VISIAFTMAAAVILAAAVVARMNGRIGNRALYALVGVSQFINLVNAAVHSSPVAGSINAAGFALSVWLWWRDGGGDDTKRRLRRWARKCEGVRRTAPVPT
jgi:hypothetical protein